MLTSCLPATDLPESSDRPSFDPIAYFAGPTSGRGTLSTVIGGRQELRVASMGTALPGGALSLIQQIALTGEPQRERTWIIRPLGGGRYTGSLTEAVGPVEASVRGNSMTIRYATKDYHVRQRLVLGQDGAVHNRLDIYKWGLNVARLGERIGRTIPPPK